MKISILFGGITYEHEISIVSAIALMQKSGMNISYCIFLDSKHEFYLIDKSNMKSKHFSSNDYKKAQKLEISTSGFVTASFLGKKKVLDVGVILNLIHGADGEDGILSGLFGFFRIPFIGPRLEASILSYNKHLTKMYAQSKNIPTLPFTIYKKNEPLPQIRDFPVIVKPARLGSSIGITVVKEAHDLEYAMEVSFEYDDTIIIEPFMSGIKEYNLAGAKIHDKFVFSLIEEPQKKDLLDFNDKYLDFSRTQEITDVKISQELQHNMQEVFKNIYSAMFEGALIRCDFFVIEDKIYLNEINPVPGSMANYLFPNFWDVIEELAMSLPSTQNIKVSYQYIDKIHHVKGK